MASIEDKEFQFLKKMKSSSYSELNVDMMILKIEELCDKHKELIELHDTWLDMKQ